MPKVIGPPGTEPGRTRPPFGHFFMRLTCDSCTELFFQTKVSLRAGKGMLRSLTPFLLMIKHCREGVGVFISFLPLRDSLAYLPQRVGKKLWKMDSLLIFVIFTFLSLICLIALEMMGGG